MNRNILTFLNEYAEIPDPQYAIMLRGAWGCGMIFFQTFQSDFYKRQ